MSDARVYELLCQSAKVGERAGFSAKDLGLNDEAFHAEVARWVREGGTGFEVDGPPHRDSDSGNRFYDHVFLRRTE